MKATLDPSSTAGQVYRQVLRHIRKNRLGEGDRLPPQSRWLSDLGCGTVPFNSAMRLLEDHGVVQRRPTGTTLLRAAPDRRITWSVGVCMPKLPTASNLYPTLVQFLLLRLQAMGCQLHIYRFNRKTPLRYFNRITDFDELKQDIEAGQLDGLLNISRLGRAEHQYLQRRGVVSGQLIAHHPAEPGVSYDTVGMIRQAVGLLREKGCRHIALAYPNSHACVESYGTAHQEAFRQAMGESNATEFSGPEFAPGGQQVARQLLELRPGERPDGLVCIRDEHFTLGLTQTLRQDGGYRPAIASPASRQAPLPFFLPVYRFEVDLEEVVDKAVRLILGQLQSPRESPTQARVALQLSGNEPAELPQEMLITGGSFIAGPFRKGESS